MRYSVSPRVKLRSGGPKPMEKRRTFTPTSLGEEEVPELVHEDEHPEQEHEGGQVLEIHQERPPS